MGRGGRGGKAYQPEEISRCDESRSIVKVSVAEAQGRSAFGYSITETSCREEKGGRLYLRGPRKRMVFIVNRSGIAQYPYGGEGAIMS